MKALVVYHRLFPERVRAKISPLAGSVLKPLTFPWRGFVRRYLPLVGKLIDGYQISPEAVHFVRRNCGPGSNLLVFGLGNDTATWEAINKGGTTTFLEDNGYWFNRIAVSPTRSCKHLIRYSTTVGASVDFESPSDIPSLELPNELRGRRFDVVVVDGPMGSSDDSPGRAQSILLASRLVQPDGWVLIDDYSRDLEREISIMTFGRLPEHILDSTRPVAVFAGIIDSSEE